MILVSRLRNISKNPFPSSWYVFDAPRGDGPLCGRLRFSAPQRGKWCPLPERWSVTPNFVLEFVPNIRMEYYRTYVCIEGWDAVI